VILAVLDTNVLASGLIRSKKDVAPVLLLDAWRQRQFDLVVSQHILSELAATLASPYFRRRLTLQQVTADLALFQGEAIVTSITERVQGIATHPEDDLILATALSAKADYLVTGDMKLQRLDSYQGVNIVDPRTFVEILVQQVGQPSQS